MDACNEYHLCKVIFLGADNGKTLFTVKMSNFQNYFKTKSITGHTEELWMKTTNGNKCWSDRKIGRQKNRKGTKKLKQQISFFVRKTDRQKNRNKEVQTTAICLLSCWNTIHKKLHFRFWTNEIKSFCESFFPNSDYNRQFGCL